MAQETQDPITTNDQQDNEIPLDQLPVEVKAYKDENGFALVLKSKDKRIGSSNGTLVDNFLVRILDGEVPKVSGVHSVAVAENQARHVEVAESRIDEKGRLFIKSATDGVKRPAVKK